MSRVRGSEHGPASLRPFSGVLGHERHAEGTVGARHVLQVVEARLRRRVHLHEDLLGIEMALQRLRGLTEAGIGTTGVPEDTSLLRNPEIRGLVLHERGRFAEQPECRIQAHLVAKLDVMTGAVDQRVGAAGVVELEIDQLVHPDVLPGIARRGVAAEVAEEARPEAQHLAFDGGVEAFCSREGLVVRFHTFSLFSM